MTAAEIYIHQCNGQNGGRAQYTGTRTDAGVRVINADGVHVSQCNFQAYYIGADFDPTSGVSHEGRGLVCHA